MTKGSSGADVLVSPLEIEGGPSLPIIAVAISLSQRAPRRVVREYAELLKEAIGHGVIAGVSR